MHTNASLQSPADCDADILSYQHREALPLDGIIGNQLAITERIATERKTLLTSVCLLTAILAKKGEFFHEKLFV